MVDLTARQVQILRAVVQEFIDTANPVGSETIDKKYNLGVSPATIRNEMVHLTKLGYLRKSHSSSGRQPTPQALKLYIRELMREKDLSVADEVSLKERIWAKRKEFDDLLREATKVLADKTRAVGVAITPERDVYSAGYSHLLTMPEFFDIEVARNTLSLIEEFQLLHDIFEQGSQDNTVHVIFGEELGNQNLEPLGLVYIDIQTGNEVCHIGVLGSNRFDYGYVFPMMRYFQGLMKELLQ